MPFASCVWEAASGRANRPRSKKVAVKMADDNRSRGHRPNDPYGRARPTAAPQPAGDPLAELARLIGQQSEASTASERRSHSLQHAARSDPEGCAGGPSAAAGLDDYSSDQYGSHKRLFGLRQRANSQGPHAYSQNCLRRRAIRSALRRQLAIQRPELQRPELRSLHAAATGRRASRRRQLPGSSVSRPTLSGPALRRSPLRRLRSECRLRSRAGLRRPECRPLRLRARSGPIRRTSQAAIRNTPMASRVTPMNTIIRPDTLRPAMGNRLMDSRLTARCRRR